MKGMKKRLALLIALLLVLPTLALAEGLVDEDAIPEGGPVPMDEAEPAPVSEAAEPEVE